jgi:hypothetical protein
MPVNYLGREDKTDFETLQGLSRELENRCYEKWRLPLITHSNTIGEYYDKFLQIYKQTEDKVVQLNSCPEGMRLSNDIDFKIWVEYRNGIHQALEYLVKIEEGILREPRKADI